MTTIEYDKSLHQYKNKFGDNITFGSVIYFPLFLDAGSLTIKSTVVNNIVLHRKKRDKTKLQPMVLTKAYILNLDDCRKTYEDAEEVIHKWKRRVINAIEKALVS